ncbi:hypothetical protein GCM10010393_59210 [Streptomyces gobitricini]|uniref:Uncharacterized protein n=1 Tax=Streptomyces gobitricini TaxID=68211 RepID=A0ABN3NCQ6_9ACTN
MTEPVRLLPEVPERPGYDGTPGDDGRRHAPATLPRGTYAVDPEPSGAPFVPREDQDEDTYEGAYPGGPWMSEGSALLVAAGPRNTYVLHPDDVVGLAPHPDSDRLGGCCGPTGHNGVNRVCGCGAEVATDFGDCYGPYEIHFDPGAVRPGAAV